MITRRILLASAAPLAIAGCTSAQIATAQSDVANFIDQVNALVAAGCATGVPAFVALASTVESVAAALYPSVSAAIAAGVAAVNSVASAICSSVSTPVASAKLKATAPNVVARVGNANINGKIIPIYGYHQ